MGGRQPGPVCGTSAKPIDAGTNCRARTPAPATITGKDWQDKIKGKTGILFFADYRLRQGEKQPSGNHIDLWNGSRLTASGLAGALTTFARFGLGIDSGPGFSNLGNAKTILFWEIQ